jgi:hypothetical protein
VRISSASVGRNNFYRHRLKPGLPPIAPLAARATLAGLGTDRDRLRYHLSGSPILSGQVEHLRPQLLSVFNAMPRAVAADDEAMRGPYPELILDQQEIGAHLCPVPRPERAGGFHSQFAPEVYLEGFTTRLATLSRDHHGPRAVLNALERLADGYGSECDRVQRDLGIAESQLRDYQARLGKPFPHDG